MTSATELLEAFEVTLQLSGAEAARRLVEVFGHLVSARERHALMQTVVAHDAEERWAKGERGMSLTLVEHIGDALMKFEAVARNSDIP